VGYVNVTSGNFIPQHDGRTQVRVSVTGADPTKGGIAADSVFIAVTTGTYSDGNAPSDHLLIKITYSENENLIAKEETLSIGELQGIQTVSHTYSLTRSDGKYVTDSATGIEMAALLGHLGIDPGDVAWFRFAANDGANPGAITAGFLFGYNRYYFPLADWGVTNGAVSVPPMLAYADSWREGGNCDPDFSSLNNGTCLRLLFGSTGLADNSTSRSLKYINTMTIVISGAPPVGSGTGNGQGDGDGDGPGNGDEGEGSGDGDEGEGNGAGGTDDNQENSGTNTDGTGQNTNNQQNATAGDKQQTQNQNIVILNAGALREIAQETPLTESEKELQEILDSETPQGSSGAAGGSRWQVFEMMNAVNSDLPPIPFNNPLEPFLIPGILAVAIAGGGFSAFRYKRRVGPLRLTPQGV
jgi:hypothetical protein